MKKITVAFQKICVFFDKKWVGDLMLNVNDVESKTKPVACPIDVISISHYKDDLRNRYFV